MITDEVPSITSRRYASMETINNQIHRALLLTYGADLHNMDNDTLEEIFSSFEYEKRGGFYICTIYFRNENVKYRLLVEVLSKMDWY